MSTNEEAAAAAALAKSVEGIDVKSAPAAPAGAGDQANPFPGTTGPGTTVPGTGAGATDNHAGADDTTLSLTELTRATAAAAGVADDGGRAGTPRGAVGNSDDKGTATTITDNIRLGKTRESIAFRLLWLLAAVVGGYLLVSLSFSQACWESSSCNLKDAYGMAAGSFATVFAALLGLVGSVVGFYFGSQSKS